MKQASQSTKLRRKALVLALAAGFGGAASANPVNPSVIAGSALFSSVGNTLTVTNAPGTIINWQGFSIGANDLTRFVQANAASAVLNRVTGGDPSSILGALQSNGRVFLINPNGIAFGSGARVDVAGLVASTLNLSNADFQAGHLHFGEQPGAAGIVNAGQIHAAPGGRIVLVAPSVENSGLISAPNGDVLLAAGRSVRLVDLGDPEIQYEIAAPSNAVLNLGTLAGRNIGLHGGTIRHAGTISATAVDTDDFGRIVFRARGDVTLDAGSRTAANGARGGDITVASIAGDTLVSGSIDAVGASGAGGTVRVLGDRVGLLGGASINASGQTGGGTVLVGGDLRGGNPLVQNARMTYFDADASIRADAVQAGDGGKVVVWADDTTRAFGSVSARGGASAGDGGFVEVSGRQHLAFGARVDTRAPAGQAGTLLLDPTAVTVDASSFPLGTFSGGIFNGGSYGSDTIGWSTIDFQLAMNGNVVIQTNSAGPGTGNINIAAAGTLTYGGSVWFLAGNDLVVNGAINHAGGGEVKLVAGWDGNVGSPGTSAGVGMLSINAPVVTSGPAYLWSGRDISVGPGGSVSASGIDMKAGQDILINDGSVASSGFLSADAGRDIRVTASGNNASLAGVGMNLSMATGKLYIQGSTSVATVSSISPGSMTIDFPGLSTGGYVVNGIEGGPTTVGSNGLYVMGAPATLGSGLTINYGMAPPPPPPPPVVPTIDQCIADPSLAGCSTVLPTISTCISAPATLGCSVVLPTIDFCVAHPAAPGCSVVLPNLDFCIAHPAAPGCSVVLPTIDFCVAHPAAPGCSVVLPNLDFCIAHPVAPGCSIVLPTIGTCIAHPTTPGCSAVLPTLDACIAAPSIPGCSAVLPSIATCATHPSVPGCSAVFPPSKRDLVINQLARDTTQDTDVTDAADASGNDDPDRRRDRDSRAPQEVRTLRDLPECRP